MKVLTMHRIGEPTYGSTEGKVFIGRVIEQRHSSTEFFDYYFNQENEAEGRVLFEEKKAFAQAQNEKVMSS